MVVLYRIAPASRLPMHTHPHLQAGTVLEGGGQFRVGGERGTLRPGSCCSIPGGVPHELVTDPSGPSVILDIFVPEREDFLPEATPPRRPSIT